MQLHYRMGMFRHRRVCEMAAALQLHSTLTDRYQTTVPDPVRRQLGLGKRDTIQYTIRDGEVVLTRAEAKEDADPALRPFLNFLANDMASRPERLQAVDASLVHRIRALTQDVKVDLDAPLSADDE